MGTSDDSGRGPDGTLGRIALKKMSVVRSSSESSSVEAIPSSLSGHGAQGPGDGGAGAGGDASAQGSMNNLVPFLDLFSRLTDEELARLAQVSPTSVAQLRRQVDEICRALLPYADLLPRLHDEELVRLTGAPEKTVRFWRLCQPRTAPSVERTSPGAFAAESSTQLVMPERRAASRPGAAVQMAGGPASHSANVGPAASVPATSGAVFPGNEEPRPSRSRGTLPADDDDELTITQDDFF